MIREVRSYGCNGPNNPNEKRCKAYCRSQKYRTGFCSEVTGYKDCVCSKLPLSKSKLFKLRRPLPTISDRF